MTFIITSADYCCIPILWIRIGHCHLFIIIFTIVWIVDPQSRASTHTYIISKLLIQAYTPSMSRSNQHFVASLIHTIATHTSDVNSVAFSPDGTLATASGDKTVRLWDTADFSELTASPLVGHSYYVHCCTFSPFGTILATCSTDGKLILWDVKSGSKVCEHWHMINCTFDLFMQWIITGM